MLGRARGSGAVEAAAAEEREAGPEQSPLEQTPADEPTPTIEALVEAHHRAVYAYAYRLTGRTQDAEDLVQQTFLVAQEHLDQLREARRAKGWLMAIARSQYSRLCRRKRPFLADDAEIELEQIAVDGEDETSIDRERLQAALDRLPPDSRTVLLMYYMEHLSYKQIAADLGVPIGTVMSRLARAKRRLRSWLGKERP